MNATCFIHLKAYCVLYAYHFNNQHWGCTICHLLGEGLLLLSNHTLHFLASSVDI